MRPVRTFLFVVVLASITACGMARGPEAQVMAPAQHPTPAVPAASPPPASSALDADSLFSLLTGELAGQRGQVDLAVRHYLFAARITREPAVAERAAKVALFAHDPASAQEAVRLFVELAPQNPEARQLAALIELRAGNPDLSRAQLEELIRLSPSGPGQAFVIIDQLFAREAKSPEGLAVLVALAANHPEVPEAQCAVAHQAERVGDVAAARAAYDRCLALRPDWVPAHAERARFLIAQGDGAGARAGVEAALRERAGDPALRMIYAQVLVQTGEPALARAEFERLVADHPDDTDLVFALGLLDLDLEDYTAARKHLLHVAQKPERRSEAAFYLARLAERENRREEALEWYAEVQGTHRVDAQIRSAVLLAEMGRIDEGRAALVRMRSEQPEFAVRSYLAEGEILALGGGHAEAVELYSEALGRHPDDPDLLYARALAGEKIGRLDILEADLHRIIANDPNHAHALNALGYTLVDRTNRFDEARGYIQRAMILEPGSAAILDSMGWLEFRLGNFESSARLLRQALDLQFDPEIATHLSAALDALGDRSGARAVLDQALARLPEDPTLRQALDRLGDAR